MNESGKTTILEAINNFTYGTETTVRSKDKEIGKLTDKEIIPISKLANPAVSVKIKFTIKIDNADRDFILKRLKARNPNIKAIRISETSVVTTQYSFNRAKLEDIKNNFSYRFSYRNDARYSRFQELSDNDLDIKKSVEDLISMLFPKIIYLPDFAFSFPGKIFLDAKDSRIDIYYKRVLQDILDTINPDYDVDRDLLDRISKEEEMEELNALLILMQRNLTKVIIEDWKGVFGDKSEGKSIVLKAGSDVNNRDGTKYIEFKIHDGNGETSIDRRSLGFRWFFIFRLLTYYRSHRKKDSNSKKIVFLLDEPASNLHQTAQMRLLDCFKEFPENCYLIYATHSHYLINPCWLENTYIIKNESAKYLPELGDYRETNITATKYRKFVAANPEDVAYFMPILDALEYRPSLLEPLKNALLVEGKNDFYTLMYLSNVLKEREFPFDIIPGTGCGKLDTLISLYTGWGRNFHILLDNDKRIEEVVLHYINNWGDNIKNIIHKLDSLTNLSNVKAMESLFSEDDKDLILNGLPYSKDNFNHRIQELLATRNYSLQFGDFTINNFKCLFENIRNLFSSGC